LDTPGEVGWEWPKREPDAITRANDDKTPYPFQRSLPPITARPSAQIIVHHETIDKLI
jgi:hypothetical protein